jgi:hypothetical protein
MNHLQPGRTCEFPGYCQAPTTSTNLGTEGVVRTQRDPAAGDARADFKFPEHGAGGRGGGVLDRRGRPPREPKGRIAERILSRFA